MTIKKKEEEKRKQEQTSLQRDWWVISWKIYLKPNLYSYLPGFLRKRTRIEEPWCLFRSNYSNKRLSASCSLFQEEKVITMTGVAPSRRTVRLKVVPKLHHKTGFLAIFSKLIPFLNIFFPPTIKIKIWDNFGEY